MGFPVSADQEYHGLEPCFMSTPLLLGPDREGVRSDHLISPSAGHTSSTFATFAAMPSNIRAFETSHRFCLGVHRLVAVFGPSGWGKTHLAESVTQHLREQGVSVESCRAMDWLMMGSRKDGDVLVLDDAQDASQNPKARQRLRQMLERTVRSGRPAYVNFSGPKPAFGGRNLVPSHREWVLVSIGSPNADEREIAVRQIAKNLDVLVSRTVARLIARHLNGNGRSIAGAMHRLKLSGNDYSTPHDAMRVCGLLCPYWLGVDGWDPRDVVHDAISRELASDRPQEQHLLRAATSYLMMFEMGIPERDVASFLSVTPGEAYELALYVRQHLVEGDGAELVGRLRESVARALEA